MKQNRHIDPREYSQLISDKIVKASSRDRSVLGTIGRPNPKKKKKKES